MCRLFMANIEFLMSSGIPLEKHLQTLEDRLGGDGNGVAAWSREKGFRIVKRTDLTCKRAAKLIHLWASEGYEWFFFHTRLATSGGVCDEMCHPFFDSNSKTLMAHNGVVSNLTGFWLEDVPVSDTRFLFHLATNYSGNYHRTLYDTSGAFIGIRDNLPYVIKASTSADLVAVLSERDQGMCFTSQWYLPEPAHYQVWDVRMGMWTDGEIETMRKMLSGRHVKGYWDDFTNYLTPEEYDALTVDEKQGYYLISYNLKGGKPVRYYKPKTKYWSDNGVKSSYTQTSWAVTVPERVES